MGEFPPPIPFKATRESEDWGLGIEVIWDKEDMEWEEESILIPVKSVTPELLFRLPPLPLAAAIVTFCKLDCKDEERDREAID